VEAATKHKIVEMETKRGSGWKLIILLITLRERIMLCVNGNNKHKKGDDHLCKIYQMLIAKPWPAT